MDNLNEVHKLQGALSATKEEEGHGDGPASNVAPDHLADYNLHRPIQPQRGMRQGLPNYGDPHFALFLRKAFIKALGYSEDALARPIVGIINTYSAFNPCHANVPQLIEAAKRGVQLHGGLAMDFPTISIHESFSSPTSMFLRNLMSMDTEEMIKAQPVDACIVIGGEFCPPMALAGCWPLLWSDETRAEENGEGRMR